MNKSKIAGFALGQMGAAILGAVSLPVIAWFFSVGDIGRISMLQVACNFSVILFSLGLDQAYVREYHELSAEKKPVLLRSVFLPGFSILLFALGGLFLFDMSVISRLLFSINSIAISLITMICLIAAFVLRYSSLVLRMQEHAWVFCAGKISQSFLFLLFICFVVLLAKDLNFQKLAIAYCVSCCSAALIYIWGTRKVWLNSVASSVEAEFYRQTLAFGFPLFLGGIASWALTAMDKVFLRGMSTYDELGIYSVATSIASSVGVLSGVFSLIWAPMVYKWSIEGQDLKKVDDVSKNLVVIVSGILVFTGLFAWTLRFILPEEYSKVQFIVGACMIPMLFYILAETANIGIGISRKTVYSMLSAMIAALFNAIANAIMVPRFGAQGAAVSTAVAFWIFLIVRMEVASRIWRPMPKLAVYSVSSLSLAFVVGYATGGADSYPIWIAISVLLFICWICFSFRKLKYIVSLFIRSKTLSYPDRNRLDDGN